MAPTLLFTDYHASNLSQQPIMPQVFVVPPEEDDTPAWCCFDASASDPPRRVLREEFNAPSLFHDLKEVQSSIDTIPMPKSNGETNMRMDLMNGDYMKSNGDMSLDVAESEQEPDFTDSEDVGHDSEVVEVVKISRYTDIEEPFRTSTPPPLQTSKSLRARASRALQTFKIAGKGSLRSRNKAEIILPPSKKEVLARTNVPISRRSSAAFSQISSSSTTLQSPPSVSSFDLVEAPPTPLEGSRYPSSLRNVSSNAQPLPLPSSNSATSHSHQSSSHNPTTQTASNRRHFSLNRIFSFSKSDGVLDSVPISRSRNPSGPSTDSSSAPDTQTEERTPLDPGHTLPLGHKRVPKNTSALEERDVSFEMRLDSLHFDSLSFDLDRFLSSSHC